MEPRIASTWGDWLSGPDFSWQAWGTFTFRDPGYSNAAATRSWDRFTSWLRREGSPGVGFFVGHEVGARGRLHLHALLGGLAPQTRRSALWAWWFERYGRAQLLPYDPARGAAHYVAKYVTKDFAHYDIERCRGRWARHQLDAFDS